MLKKLLKVVLALVLLLIVVVVGLALFLNTEQYKSALETALANSTGYQLNIAGELELDFFPTMGLTLNDVRLRNPASPQELASTSQISLRVDRGMLFRGQLLIQELVADDFHINYYVDETGSSIWDVDSPLVNAAESRTQASDADSESPIEGPDTDSDDEIISLSFAHISIANASIDYQDLSNSSRYSIDNLNIESQNSNIEGRPFRLDLDFRFLNNGMTEPVNMGLKSTVIADVRNGKINITDLNINLTPLLLVGEVTVSNSNETLSYTGSFESNSFDVMGLMRSLGISEVEDEFTGRVQNFRNLSFKFEFSGDQDQFALDSLAATSGDSEIAADASVRFVTDFSPTNVSYNIVTNAIDLTPLLVSEEAAAEVEADSAAANTPSLLTATPPQQDSDTPLPLDTLNAMNVLGSIHVESLTANEWYLQDINIFTYVEDGVLDIELQPVTAYGGTLQGSLRLDGRESAAILTTQLSLNELKIVEFPSNLSRLNSVTGSLNVEAAYTAAGSTSNALLDSVSGSTSLVITESSVDIGVIKQVFTAIAAFSPTGEAIQQWPDVIQFGEFSGYMIFENGIEADQQVKLRMDNFDVTGTGGINLHENTFEYDMLFTVLGAPLRQTIPINELFHNVSWPVDCSAAFADEVTRYCRPEFAQVRDIFNQIGTNTARNRLQDVIPDQVPDELHDAARGLLRNIFN
ncbi:MAG: AsmA family protein [Proteobacteria bacterium]|nr:AsmA family protein [Pseudomonadota bacterium]